MKGDEQVISKLNELLEQELTAINQYMVHSEMDENWGYGKLHDSVEKRAFTEMKHAESLIERILYLEGTPIVSNLGEIHIGSDVPKQHKSDLGLEKHAVAQYNEAIGLAVEKGDNGTRELLTDILTQEEEHIDDLEARLDQIDQMGLPNYLTQQV
ncbi:MAG TPA: bacterioferritin [Anaerohalosphaeraceae bacterium]|jgi:bacterioferritin|nr:bacterioferritin [Anaerohalosphaeraceae bacterium]HRT50187.1 bacterioferritin [Anaerohalosphaeraceae bacterium]HRT86118.1 bacterioferritin [Anaerohalosphaeraceae bacterium]